MNTLERIHQGLQKSPGSLHSEVLEFIEYLLVKTERKATQKEASEWSSLSLTLAMSDMEDEDTPSYSLEDLKEKFE